MPERSQLNSFRIGGVVDQDAPDTVLPEFAESRVFPVSAVPCRMAPSRLARRGSAGPIVGGPAQHGLDLAQARWISSIL